MRRAGLLTADCRPIFAQLGFLGFAEKKGRARDLDLAGVWKGEGEVPGVGFLFKFRAFELIWRVD